MMTFAVILAVVFVGYVLFLFACFRFREVCGFYPDEGYKTVRLFTRNWTYVVQIRKSGDWEHTVELFRFQEKPKVKLEDLFVKVCGNKVSALCVLWVICSRLHERIAKLKVVKSVEIGETYELFELWVKVVRAISTTHAFVEDVNYCGARMVVPISHLKKVFRGGAV